MLQSFVLAALIGTIVFLILNMTATREEAFLKSKFGFAYVVYTSATPKIIPEISLFSTSDDVAFSVHHLRNSFSDALVFIALVPLSEAIGWLRGIVSLPAMVLM